MSDPDAEIAELSEPKEGEAGLSLDAIQRFIAAERKEIARVESSVPIEPVHVGLFAVDCSKLRVELMSKHERKVELLLALLEKNTVADCEGVDAKFKDIRTELEKFPSDIEELTDMKNFIDDIPAKLNNELRPAIEQAVRAFDVLDEAKHRVARASSDIKWRVYGLPRATEEKMVEVQEMLEQEKLRFVGLRPRPMRTRPEASGRTGRLRRRTSRAQTSLSPTGTRM